MIDLKEFKTKAELFKHLFENKEQIIELKKATIKNADAFNTPFNLNVNKDSAQKNVINKADEETTIKRTIIGNSYNWLDSHGDVHVKGCFKKSIKERTNKIFHLHDHEFKITSQVGKFRKIYEKNIAWRDLGVNLDGETTSLMADSEIKQELNSFVFAEYKAGNINQHSVGMIYTKIFLAVDSDAPEMSQEKENFDNYVNLIGNKEKAVENGFFWIVKEAKLLEISAVLIGSNELTGTIEENKNDIQENEPSQDTQINEPSQDTQKDAEIDAHEFKNLLMSKKL